MGEYYANRAALAAEASESERAAFIRNTYQHVACAILTFGVLEAILLKTVPVSFVASMVTGYNWLIVLGAFMFVSWLAENWARSNASREMQYLGLGAYIAAEAFIFLPLITLAEHVAPQAISHAAVLTLLLTAGITFVAFTTGKDFSFMQGALQIAGFLALGLILSSILFGFQLGALFSAAMIAFAGGCVLYDTSNIIHHYRTDQHVAAALGLFASIALMFWYVLRLLIALRD